MSSFIRLRGLPWSATNQEILDFLKNVKVVDGAKGIHLAVSRYDGKNTGEAYVEVETKDDEVEAFKLNKETIGHRYIEVFNATREEAEGSMKSAFTPSNVVKLRGLPFSVTEETIEEFFSGLELKPDREGILIVMDRRGRATGEAFVQFENQEDTEQALKRNREKIGHRYIEIFRSSVAELRRQTSGGGRPGPYDKKDRGASRGGNMMRNDYIGRGGDDWGGNGNGYGNNNFMNKGGYGSNNSGSGGGGFGSGDFGDFNNFGNNRFNDSGNSGNFGNAGGGGVGAGFGGNGGSNNFGNSGNFGGGNFEYPRSAIVSPSNSFGPIGGGRNDATDSLFALHMRGLPFSCFEKEIYDFFDPIRPSSVSIEFNNKGLHSGSADAFFDNYNDAMDAMKKNRAQMGSRYIELFFDGKAPKSSSAYNRRI